MTELDFARLLARGYETRGVEFKGPGNKTHAPFLAVIIRAILGMSNRRDGGYVIIGVESESLDPIGLDDDVVKSWLNYDELATRVNEHASPSVRFDLEALTYQDLKFVIIRVYEFDDIPILCSKELSVPQKGAKHVQILRRGACYVRASHKPETSEIPSVEEMRELLELAIDKGVRKFVTRAQKAGLLPILPNLPAPPSDEITPQRQVEEME